MNEQSPEAKQAAIPVARAVCLMLGKAVERNTTAKDGYFHGVSVGNVARLIGEGYDSAIAKWKEVALRNELARTHADAATAKAREEYEEVLTDHRRLVRELDVALNGGGAARQASLCDIVAQVRQLAHQPLDSARDKQPSAITTNEQAYRDGTLSQPSAPTAASMRHKCGYFISPQSVICNHCGEAASAPTADVEKIAEALVADLELRGYLDFDGGEQGEAFEITQQLAKALAQARAPLVESLEDIAWGGNRPVDELRSIACAALTGAGEKWQQALDQQQQTNKEIVALVNESKIYFDPTKPQEFGAGNFTE